MPYVASATPFADVADIDVDDHGMRWMRLADDADTRRLRGICPTIKWGGTTDRPLMLAADGHCMAWLLIKEWDDDIAAETWLRRPLSTAEVNRLLRWFLGQVRHHHVRVPGAAGAHRQGVGRSRQRGRRAYGSRGQFKYFYARPRRRRRGSTMG